jgi:hypothetical protein
MLPGLVNMTENSIFSVKHNKIIGCDIDDLSKEPKALLKKISLANNFGCLLALHGVTTLTDMTTVDSDTKEVIKNITSKSQAYSGC